MKLVLDIERVLEELQRRGWSKYRFSKEAGMKNQEIYGYLSGNQPGISLRTIARFSKALQLEDPRVLIKVLRE